MIFRGPSYFNTTINLDVKGLDPFGRLRVNSEFIELLTSMYNWIVLLKSQTSRERFSSTLIFYTGRLLLYAKDLS